MTTDREDDRQRQTPATVTGSCVVLWRLWKWNRNRGFNPKPNRNLQIL